MVPGGGAATRCTGDLSQVASPQLPSPENGAHNRADFSAVNITHLWK